MIQSEHHKWDSYYGWIMLAFIKWSGRVKWNRSLIVVDQRGIFSAGDWCVSKILLMNIIYDMAWAEMDYTIRDRNSEVECVVYGEAYVVDL